MRGKSTKALVPILFTEEVVSAITLLVRNREKCGFSCNNSYVFASGQAEYRMRGWDTLQAICKRIELEKPKLITPTRTRKHLATVLQLLDMSTAELTWITNHMGHTKNVHFAWYRKEDATLELTKMAKILTAVDENRSLSLDDIQCLYGNDSGILVYLVDCDSFKANILAKLITFRSF